MKLEIHDALNHGSWLNMAEIEASVLRRQCLDGPRIPDCATLTHELQVRESQRILKQALLMSSQSI